MDLRHTPAIAINFQVLFWYFNLFFLYVFYKFFDKYRDVDFLFCSTSSSSCLLSSLKIATRQKVGESTETGQLETLDYNKCFFFLESLLHEPFDNWGLGGYRGLEVLVIKRQQGNNWRQKTHFSSIHTVTITVFISFWSCSSSPARY